MLGKSSDWVSVRSRIHKLPDALKDRLCQRARAIKQLLELAALYRQQPTVALAVADRVVDEHLTVEAIRALIHDQHERPPPPVTREEEHNCRTSATSVPNVTSLLSSTSPPAAEEGPREHQALVAGRQGCVRAQPSAQSGHQYAPTPAAGQPPHEFAPSDAAAEVGTDLLLL